MSILGIHRLQIHLANLYACKMQHLCHYNIRVKIKRHSYYPFAIIYPTCNGIKTTSTSSMCNPSTIAGDRFIVTRIILIKKSRQTLNINFVTIHISSCKLIFSLFYMCMIYTKRYKIITYPKVCWKEPISLILVA